MQNYYFDLTHPLRPYTHSVYAAHGTIAPVNALRDAPAPSPEGKYPAEKNGKWIEIEDHRGKEGFVNGNPHTILDFGPLPDGWSETPPPLTTEELFDRIRGQRDARINSVLWMRERHSDELELGTEPTLTPEQYTALLTYVQALRDIPQQDGFPWTGPDDPACPWPTLTM